MTWATTTLTRADGERAEALHYVPMPFTKEPDWAETSKNMDLGLLLDRAFQPNKFHYET